MPLEDRDAAYLWDMLQAANEAVEMMEEHDLASFLQNRMLQRAIERCVEIIGEVAQQVSPDCKATASEIPWSEIVGQQNILAHKYGQIDHELLYKTIANDIPKLIKNVQSLLPSIDAE